MSLKLEDGCAYMNTLGEIVTVSKVSDGEFPFERTNGAPELFMADGRYVKDETPASAFNLVEKLEC
ncbi:hypothetical protein GW796_09730 [archaeon]|nr:hypothetical protein [archaeon]